MVAEGITIFGDNHRPIGHQILTVLLPEEPFNRLRDGLLKVFTKPMLYAMVLV